ncbi:predicted GPI-anchored protein 58 [Miscanthus floridulus]|uniref:predicted GPI-anchored protein 58 n=1 Tax=Miscanthus floridulus TaxID=154761 RepID=UPI00345B3CAF
MPRPRVTAVPRGCLSSTLVLRRRFPLTCACALRGSELELHPHRIPAPPVRQFVRAAPWPASSLSRVRHATSPVRTSCSCCSAAPPRAALSLPLPLLGMRHASLQPVPALPARSFARCSAALPLQSRHGYAPSRRGICCPTATRAVLESSVSPPPPREPTRRSIPVPRAPCPPVPGSPASPAPRPAASSPAGSAAAVPRLLCFARYSTAAGQSSFPALLGF